MNTTRVVLAAVAIAVHVGMCADAAGAQPSAATTRQAASQPDSLVVSLLTIGPGEGLFDRFGHSAIRIRNVATGLDSAWNWGMYSFQDPALVFRFLTGETRYWMAGFGSPLFIDYYRRAGRGVWEQDLALPPAAADSLLKLLRWNALEENKFYRYDYYRDNCSTRVRDALDLVLGGEVRRGIRSGLSGIGGSVTWRQETKRLSADFPLVAFGMSFTLGPRADSLVTPWEEGFIPMRLRDRLRTVRIQSQPLVREERVLVPEGAYRERPEAPDYASNALVLGVVIAIAIVLLGRAAAVNGAGRMLLVSLAVLWHFVTGFAGTLVLWAGLFTRHVFMGANPHVLLGTPASLALVWFYARALSPNATDRTRRVALALSAISGISAIIALCLRPVAPGLAAADWAPALFMAPVHLALTLALLAHDRRRLPAQRPA